MFDRYLKLSISIVFHIAIVAWSRLAKLAGSPLPPRVVVLLYHSVQPEEIPEFERQMRYVRSHFRVLKADFREQLSDTERYVVITFDDGFQNFYQNVLPITRDNGIPVTVFVPSGYIGDTANWEMSRKYGNPGLPLMNRQQLQFASLNNVTIGSHGRRHFRWSRIDRKTAREEIFESKAELEGICGIPVLLYAFPYGEYGEDAISLCKEAGYERAFTAIPSFGDWRPSGYLVGRVDTSAKDSVIEFRLKCKGAYQWLPIAIRIKNRMKAIFGRKSNH